MRARLREALDADLDIAVRAFSGTKSDRRLWASIAWRVGIEEFHHALLNKLAEDSSDSAPRSTFRAEPSKTDSGKCWNAEWRMFYGKRR